MDYWLVMNKNKVAITIFTPTFNRAECLVRLYHSLCSQSCDSFEWLIIDDGSIDDTFKVIENFKNEHLINVRYFFQENQGKHVAFNKAVYLAVAPLFMCLDSDDYLESNAIEVLYTYYMKYSEKALIAGFSCNTQFFDGSVVGTVLPGDEVVVSHYDLYNRYKIKGDKGFIYKLDILKQYPFPVFENEKFVTEALVLNRISHKYKICCINQSLINIEYMWDGLSQKYSKLCIMSPLGYYTYLNELGLFKQPCMTYILNYGRFVKFGLINNKSYRSIYRDSIDKRFYTSLAIFIGILMYLKFWLTNR